jgi:DNA-directed RNA polymerase II subunit RPB2
MDQGSLTKVFINGNWIGIHKKADYLIDVLKKLRRKMEIPKEISIVRDIQNKEIRLYTDAGRVQRPLFIVENGSIKLKRNHIA